MFNTNKNIYPLILIVAGIVFMLSGHLFGQDCISMTSRVGNLCVQTLETKSSTIAKLKRADEGSLEKLFYQYFAETDYQGYKNLFLPADWYGLSAEEFTSWRAKILHLDFKEIGHIEYAFAGKDFGIIKYTYIMEDAMVYETFLAKKVGSQWRPTSSKEEQDYLPITESIRFFNIDYVSSLGSTARQQTSNQTNGFVSNGILQMEVMLKAKDSLRVYAPETFKQQFNNEFEFLTKDKFNEDRLNDSKFTTYLMQEMQLTLAQVDIVMKYIYAQDYFHAAGKADELSSVSYTYATYVDKIREIYGRDRIRKWDQANQKWD